MVDIKELAKASSKKRIKWGFIWALLCAFLWGMGYVPLGIVWELPVFANAYDFMAGSVIIAAFQAMIFVFVVLFFWTLLMGKIKETAKALVNVKISKWIWIGALFGGPIAVLGTAMATGGVGASFAAAIALLSAVVGTVAARLIFKEKLTTKSIIGLILLVVGGFVILDPTTLMNEISQGGSITGYLGGIMAAVGFGLEGVFAATAMDVTDADSSVGVKYITESLSWIIILLPMFAALLGWDSFWNLFISAATDLSFIFWMVVGGFSLGMCYVTMYKCYPLLGVGRTQAITAIYVPVSIVALWVFLGSQPSLWVVAGTIIALAGLFSMIGDSSSIEGSTRGGNEEAD